MGDERVVARVRDTSIHEAAVSERTGRPVTPAVPDVSERRFPQIVEKTEALQALVERIERGRHG